ncbi:hypothetical protein [Butyrivibrio sp. MC2021]|uniref:hypothetical protein n=1 Tax=Butyrivibrio sp. MC2021 TaxID=1408306 RepID=UPI001FA6F5DF|nr:hypothetical protein [Butyrivibrio sp. MC2021]
MNSISRPFTINLAILKKYAKVFNPEKVSARASRDKTLLLLPFGKPIRSIPSRNMIKAAKKDFIR